MFFINSYLQLLFSDAVKEIAATEKGSKLYFVSEDTDDISSTKIRGNYL